MIIQIKQTQSNGEILFDVESEDRVILKGRSSWYSDLLACKLFDRNGLIFKTKIKLLEDIKNAIPYKWVWSEQLSEIVAVLDSSNQVIGGFNHTLDGYISSYYHLHYMNDSFKVYSVSNGEYEHLLIFHQDKQIGQVEKWLSVRDNLDNYILYLLDEYQELHELLALFVIYYDNYHYGHKLEYARNIEKHKRWTFSKANQFYDKNWLPHHFDVIPMENAELNTEFKAGKPKTLKIFGLIWVGFLSLGLIGVILGYLFLK